MNRTFTEALIWGAGFTVATALTAAVMGWVKAEVQKADARNGNG